MSLLCIIVFSIDANCVISDIFLVPGDGGSQIEGRIDKSAVVHYVCSKKTDYWFSLWLNMELLVPIVIDCWVDNMRLTYNNITRKTSNNQGVEIRGWKGNSRAERIQWHDNHGGQRKQMENTGWLADSNLHTPEADRRYI